MIHIEEPKSKEEMDRLRKEWQMKKKMEAAEKRKKKANKDKKKE